MTRVTCLNHDLEPFLDEGFVALELGDDDPARPPGPRYLDLLAWSVVADPERHQPRCATVHHEGSTIWTDLGHRATLTGNFARDRARLINLLWPEEP